MKSFTKKRLQVMIRMDGDTFDGSDGKNTVILEGYRVSATIDLAGIGLAQANMACRIWGVPKALMDKIDTRGSKGDVNVVRKMGIKLAADDGSGQYVDVYAGHVAYAFPDYNAAPEVPIDIHASAADFYQWDLPNSSSYKGEFSVAAAIEELAKSMDFAFENNGVTAKLSNQYVSGNTLNKIRTLAQASQTVCIVHNRKVRIWPNGRGNGAPILTLSPETGLIGYPKWEYNGITATHLFNQNIVNGTEVDLHTSIEAQKGRWYCHLPIRHMLDSETPGGKWHTEVRLMRTPEGIRVN